MKNIFKNGWKGNYGSCGGGSNPIYAKPAFESVKQSILKVTEYEGRLLKVAELGCGDLMWHMEDIRSFTKEYVGLDLNVWETWKELTNREGGYNLISGIDISDTASLSKVLIDNDIDLVFCRDVLIHLSDSSIFSMIQGLHQWAKTSYDSQKTGEIRRKYAILESVGKIEKNEDRLEESLNARRVNLTRKPFYLVGEQRQGHLLIQF